MLLHTRLSLLLPLGGLLALAHSAGAQNIVQDPGFEAAPGGFYDAPSTLGSSNPWKVTTGTDIVNTNAGLAHSGSHFLIFGFTSNGGILQNLNTTPGTLYDLSFWLRNAAAGNGFPPYSVAVNWNGTDITGSPFQGPQGSWGQFTVTGLTATSASTPLTFKVNNIQQTVFLDDVRVAVNTPEPGAVALLSGLGVCGGLSVRRRHRNRK
jgi:hypothetical protein